MRIGGSPTPLSLFGRKRFSSPCHKTLMELMRSYCIFSVACVVRARVDVVWMIHSVSDGGAWLRRGRDVERGVSGIDDSCREVSETKAALEEDVKVCLDI